MPPDSQETISAQNSLSHGAEFPYDAGEAWWDGDGEQPAPLATDWAHAAARGVLANLCDRQGVKHELDDVDHDVRAEMVQSLAEIIRVAQRSA